MTEKKKLTCSQQHITVLFAKLTSPNTDTSVAASFDKISIVNSDSVDNSSIYADRATVPMSAVGLVVDLCHSLASSGNNTASIELHACNGIIISKGVENGASPEIPNLETELVSASNNKADIQRTLILRSRDPVTRCTSSN
jgi:hypothetical protein